MTAAEMAQLHALAFAGQGRAWSEAEFATLLRLGGTVHAGDTRGFALARVAAGEADLLTLAVDPAHRRAGLGRSVLLACEAAAAARGAGAILLEVAADNGAALALYRAAGYRETGRRPGYYTRPGGTRADALCLARALPRAHGEMSG